MGLSLNRMQIDPRLASLSGNSSRLTLLHEQPEAGGVVPVTSGDRRDGHHGLLEAVVCHGHDFDQLRANFRLRKKASVYANEQHEALK